MSLSLEVSRSMTGTQPDGRRFHPPIHNELLAGPEMIKNFIHYSHSYATGEMGRRIGQMPQSDGRPVVGVAGTGGSDYTVWPIGTLGFIGYSVNYPGYSLGRYANYGREYDFQIMRKAIQKAVDKAGEKAILVGHSLGGVMGRMYAHLYPDEIDTVVTLGSPNKLDPKKPTQGAANTTVEKVVTETTSWMRQRPEMMEALEQIHKLPEGVRGIAYFTREDGVVMWELCQDNNPGSKCIEVRGTHMLLPSNPQVLGSLPYVLPQDPNSHKDNPETIIPLFKPLADVA